MIRYGAQVIDGRLPRVVRLTLLLCVATAGCGSGDDPKDAGFDAGPSDATADACVSGTLFCVGQEVRICQEGGDDPVETCPDELVCAPGLGCRSCQPNRRFCERRTVRLCSSDGMTSAVERECPATEVCRSGECVNACALAATERSNVGCDYMAVDLDNEFTSGPGGASAANEQFAVVLGNPSEVPVQATVFRSDGQPNSPVETMIETVSVAPNDVARIDLPAREVDGSSPPTVEGPGTFLSNRAYRIRTNFPVVAYQFNPIVQSFSNDAALLLPVPALGDHYRVLGWSTANPIGFPGISQPGLPDHSYVTIVGTQPGTTVRVTLGGPIVGGGSQDGSTSIPATTAGGVVELTIGPYDVLNLESDTAPGDLSGTVVESTLPVAVFSGGERGIAPSSIAGVPVHPDGLPDEWCCSEHLEEQVFPTVAWGREFVVTRSPVRSDHPTWREPDIYRVLADKPGTVITTTLDPPNDRFTLEENQWVEFAADRPFTMSATEAVSIQQIPGEPGLGGRLERRPRR